MDEQLEQMLKYIRLGGLLANWDRYLSFAQKSNYSHARLLKYVVEEEYKIKKENARKMRLARARIPEKYVIETFPFDRQPKLNKKKILNMYDRFDYMEKCRNLIFMGPTGTGRLPVDRRAGICGGRAGAGRAVFYPHEQTAQEKNNADHLQPWLFSMVVFFEK